MIFVGSLRYVHQEIGRKRIMLWALTGPMSHFDIGKNVSSGLKVLFETIEGPPMDKALIGKLSLPLVVPLPFFLPSMEARCEPANAA
jgi:hypothetical protein